MMTYQKSKNRAPTLFRRSAVLLFCLFYDTERYMEHDLGFYDTPTLDTAIKNQNALKRAYSVKFDVLTKLDKRYNLYSSVNL
jgi:hypothetical protein